MAKPTELANPWPKGPVVVSIPELKYILMSGANRV